MLGINLTFYGLCREALSFYSDIMNAEIVSIETFGEKQDEMPIFSDSKYRNLIYRAVLKVYRDKETSYIILSDSPLVAFSNMNDLTGCRDNIAFDISFNNKNELVFVYEKFIENNAKLNRPLSKTADHELYASLIDQFNVCWSLYYL